MHRPRQLPRLHSLASRQPPDDHFALRCRRRQRQAVGADRQAGRGILVAAEDERSPETLRGFSTAPVLVTAARQLPPTKKRAPAAPPPKTDRIVSTKASSLPHVS